MSSVLTNPNQPNNAHPHPPYKNTANIAPANPSPKIGCTIAAAPVFVDAGALPVAVDDPPELDPDAAVAVPLPELLELPALLPLADKLALLTETLAPVERPALPVEPAPTVEVTTVTAATVGWEVMTEGWEVMAEDWAVMTEGMPVTTPRELVELR